MITIYYGTTHKEITQQKKSKIKILKLTLEGGWTNLSDHFPQGLGRNFHLNI